MGAAASGVVVGGAVVGFVGKAVVGARVGKSVVRRSTKVDGVSLVVEAVVVSS